MVVIIGYRLPVTKLCPFSESFVKESGKKYKAERLKWREKAGIISGIRDCKELARSAERKENGTR